MVTVGFRVPKRVHRILKEMAEENDLYLSVLVERIIRDNVDKVSLDDIEKIESTATVRREVYELLRKKAEEIEVPLKTLLSHILVKAVEEVVAT